jgi:hypothetical protein
MGFTVAHKGGMGDREYARYLPVVSRVLLKQGVSLDNVPRVAEDGSADRWQYVWEREPEAEEFVKELRRVTRDRGWYVRPAEAAPSWGPLRPIDLHVARRADGWVFQVPSQIQQALQTRFPESCRYFLVSIRSDRPPDLEADQQELRELVRPVLFLLTGLSADQLAAFGSYRVIDPVEEKVLIPPTPFQGGGGTPAAGGAA